MARMSIDDSVGRDPRVTVLSQILGWSRRETVGCLVLEVWAICYDQRTHLLSERIVDAAAMHPGFAAAMLESELATRDRSGKLHITGAKKRIEYLEQKSASGRAGGLKSGESRRNTPKQTSSTTGSTTGSTPQAPRNPPSPSPVPDVAPVPVPALPDKSSAPASPRASPEPSGPHQQAIAEFQGYYERTHAGARPTWPGKNAKLMSSLVKAHGAHEIVRRISVLEKTPPVFPPTPWDFGTFAQHFDRIAQATQQARSSGRIEPREAHEYPEGEVSL